MVRADVARRERSLRRQEVPRRHELASRWRDARGRRRSRPWRSAKPGNAPRLVFSAMDASVATEIERRSPRPATSSSPTRAITAWSPMCRCWFPSQCRSSEADPAAAARARLEGADRHQSELLHHRADDGLGPLKQFGIERVIVTTLQAISGAGYPGVASMDIIANVSRSSAAKKKRWQQETQKILGDFVDGDIRAARRQSQRALQSRAGGRWPHGAASRSSSQRSRRGAIFATPSTASRGVPQERTCPARPPRPVIYMEQPDRPQPRRDAERENGMAAFVGRLRECPVFDYKFVACGHNTVRGAAGAAVLNAELMYSEGMLD